MVEDETFTTVDAATGWEIARQAADFLRSKFGATKVMLFGSLANGTFRPGTSDIDVYYEGVERHLLCRSVGAGMRTFAEYNLDLRPAQYCDPAFLESIFEYARPL